MENTTFPPCYILATFPLWLENHFHLYNDRKLTSCIYNIFFIYKNQIGRAQGNRVDLIGCN